MKRGVWLPLFVFGAAFLLLVFGAKAQAWTEFRSGDSATVSSGETVDSSLWVGAKNVDIAGTVNGDVFCGAQTVNISGTVKGDVICGAQTINVSGNVEGSVRLGAQTVNLTGSVGRNATVGAQTITTDSKSRVGGDASFGASNTHLNGQVGRDLAVGGSMVDLNGVVGRDVKGGADKITLAGSAKVGGGVEYTSKNKIAIADGASVAGKVIQHAPKQKSGTFASLLIFHGVVALVAALFLLVTALIVTALLPQFVHKVSNQAMNRVWWVLLTGFVASIMVPILFVLLLMTVIGIPLAILMIFSWLLIAFSSGLFTAYYVGRKVWRTQTNPLLRVLAGGPILLILFLIPYLGFFVMLVAFWLGAGMVLLELKDRYHRPKYQLK
ncbi:polymer-forming cytoskeletal protein [Candidatus Saccharibacteria bacterium]|nr:polymer-forming cytoskeletal protein [Candidatus Saccharibacteria bacterium]